MFVISECKSVNMQGQASTPGSIWQKLRASGIALHCREVEQQPQLELGHAQFGLHQPVPHQITIFVDFPCGASNIKCI